MHIHPHHSATTRRSLSSTNPICLRGVISVFVGSEKLINFGLARRKTFPLVFSKFSHRCDGHRSFIYFFSHSNLLPDTKRKKKSFHLLFNFFFPFCLLRRLKRKSIVIDEDIVLLLHIEAHSAIHFIMENHSSNGNWSFFFVAKAGRKKHKITNYRLAIINGRAIAT